MKKIKVSYLGLNGIFGRVSSGLLKQSPCVEKLTIYDDSEPSQPVEDDNLYFGPERLRDAVKDVNIVVIGDETCACSEKDRLDVVGRKVVRYTEAVLESSPNAIVIVASSPINVMVPLVGHVLGPVGQTRLLGATSVDTLRASRLFAGLLETPQRQTHVLPVVGGSSLTTRVPLFSQIYPKLDFCYDVRGKLIENLKSFDCQKIREMDAVERAYSTVRFIHSVFHGFLKGSPIPDIAMAKTSVISGVDYFSLPMLIGEKGVEKQFPLPCIDTEEEKIFIQAVENLNKDAETALSLFQRIKSDRETESVHNFSRMVSGVKQTKLDSNKRNKHRSATVHRAKVRSHRVGVPGNKSNISVREKTVPTQPAYRTAFKKYEKRAKKSENLVEILPSQASIADGTSNNMDKKVNDSNIESTFSQPNKSECSVDGSEKTIGSVRNSRSVEDFEDVENDYTEFLETDVTSHLERMKTKTLGLEDSVKSTTDLCELGGGESLSIPNDAQVSSVARQDRTSVMKDENDGTSSKKSVCVGNDTRDSGENSIHVVKMDKPVEDVEKPEMKVANQQISVGKQNIPDGVARVDKKVVESTSSKRSLISKRKSDEKRNHDRSKNLTLSHDRVSVLQEKIGAMTGPNIGAPRDSINNVEVGEINAECCTEICRASSKSSAPLVVSSGLKSAQKVVSCSPNSQFKSCKNTSKEQEEGGDVFLVSNDTMVRQNAASSSRSAEVLNRNSWKHGGNKKRLSKLTDINANSLPSIPTAQHYDIKTESKLNPKVKIGEKTAAFASVPHRNIPTIHSDSSGKILCLPGSEHGNERDKQTTVDPSHNSYVDDQVSIPAKTELSPDTTQEYFVRQRDKDRQSRHGPESDKNSSIPVASESQKTSKINQNKEKSKNQSNDKKSRSSKKIAGEELKHSSSRKSGKSKAAHKRSKRSRVPVEKKLHSCTKKEKIVKDKSGSALEPVKKVEDTTDLKDDVWESKYFTKASEMFFRMFRDTVTSNKGAFELKEARPKSLKERIKIVDNSQKVETPSFKGEFSGKASQEVLKVSCASVGKHQSETTDLKKNKVYSQSFDSVDKIVKKKVPRTNQVDGRSSLSSKTSSEAQNKAKFIVPCMRKRFEKQEVIAREPPIPPSNNKELKKVKSQNGNSSLLAEAKKVSHDEKTSSATSDNKINSENMKKEISFDKLFEESSAIPLLTPKGSDSKSSGTRMSSLPKSLSDGVIATSDKGRGDALNVVDFSIYTSPKPPEIDSIEATPSMASESNKSPLVKKSSARYEPRFSFKRPDFSKNIKQVSVMSKQAVLLTKKQEADVKSEKTNKWERIVTIFKNIIINDIEGANLQPKFVDKDEVKPQHRKKLEIKVQPFESSEIPIKVPKLAGKSKPVFKAKRPPESFRKKKETKQLPDETIRGNKVIKNNPKKIVNYFSKRGQTSTYEKPYSSYGQPQGVLGGSSTKTASRMTHSLNSPTKIK